MRQLEILKLAEAKANSINMKLTPEERLAYKMGLANGMKDMQQRLKLSGEYAFCNARCNKDPWSCDTLLDEDDCKPLSKFISLMMNAKEARQ